MARGKQKGFKKETLEIRDKSLDPFYIIKDDRQFIVMKEGNSLPQGYYNRLSFALSQIAKSVHLTKNAGNSLSINNYIKTYEDISNRIIDSVNV